MCVCVSLSFCSTCANASENMHAQYSCDVLDFDEVFMGCSAARQGFLDHKAHQIVFYVCIPYVVAPFPRPTSNSRRATVDSGRCSVSRNFGLPQPHVTTSLSCYGMNVLRL